MRLNAIQTVFISDSQLIPEKDEENKMVLDFSIKNDEKGVSTQIQNLEEIDMNIDHEEIQRMREKMLMERKNFTILESILNFKKGKLAATHKATLKGEEIICKIIKNERINNFIIEGFLEILCKLK
jgi:hypothetical protein